MNQGDFVDWATIVGGFAGLLSFVYVVWDKLTTRPKLISRVRKSSFRLSIDRDTKKFRVEAGVNLEIGNIGNEATTITEITLDLSDGKPLVAKQRFLVDDMDTRLCEKGIAFVEHFWFVGFDYEDTFGETITGYVNLNLLGGGKHRQVVQFTVERSQF